MGIVIKTGKLKPQLTRLQSRMKPVGIDGYGVWLAGGAHTYLQSQSRKRFENYKDGGGEWPALAAATESWRRYLGFTPIEINIRTGDLRDLMIGSRPTLVPTGGAVILLYPGTEQNKGNRPLKIAQAQGTLRQNNGQMSKPRPVITLDPEDYAALLASFVRFIKSPARGKN